jgi:hypothetical protein
MIDPITGEILEGDGGGSVVMEIHLRNRCGVIHPDNPSVSCIRRMGPCRRNHVGIVGQPQYEGKSFMGLYNTLVEWPVNGNIEENIDENVIPATDETKSEIEEDF